MNNYQCISLLRKPHLSKIIYMKMYHLSDNQFLHLNDSFWKWEKNYLYFRLLFSFKKFWNLRLKPEIAWCVLWQGLRSIIKQSLYHVCNNFLPAFTNHRVMYFTKDIKMIMNILHSIWTVQEAHPKSLSIC